MSRSQGHPERARTTTTTGQKPYRENCTCWWLTFKVRRKKGGGKERKLLLFLPIELLPDNVIFNTLKVNSSFILALKVLKRVRMPQHYTGVRFSGVNG
jgi:hypothetical protein